MAGLCLGGISLSTINQLGGVGVGVVETIQLLVS